MTGVLEEGARWGYVLAAYGATFAVMAALVVASLAASRRARRDLADLEQRLGRGRRRAR